MAMALWQKVAVVGGVTVVGGAVCFVTGGLAAPLVGSAIGSGMLGMGLSGAAATSAGLAALGGGSLAAGGAGVAGGTLVVATVAGAAGAVTAGSGAALASGIHHARE